MKTQEELNSLKEEVEILNKKLAELTEEELAQVTGGNATLNEQPNNHFLYCGTQCLAVGNKVLRNGQRYTLISIANEEDCCRYYFFCAADRTCFIVKVTTMQENLLDCTFYSAY